MALGSKDHLPPHVQARPRDAFVARGCYATYCDITALPVRPDPVPTARMYAEADAALARPGIFDMITRFVASDISCMALDTDGSLPVNLRTGALDLDMLYDRFARDASGGVRFRDDAPRPCAVAQAFARLHALALEAAPPGGADARFDFARQQVRWTHQWLIVNDLLPQLCEADVLADTLADGAPVYRAFLARLNADGFLGRLPVPLEFCAAFGTDTRPEPARSGGPSVTSLYDVTGDLRFAEPAPHGRVRWSDDTGPQFNMDGSFDARRTHRVTATPPHLPGIALPGMAECHGHLRQIGVRLPFAAPSDGAGLQAGLHEEAMETQAGHTFGPLGSRIVAETLLGLAMHTPGSFWHVPGSVNGRWHPRDGIRTNAGTLIDSYEALARIAQDA
ncbi:hypothetical protein [Pseudaestuariivita atlantica]|uniref:Uncharacterized protein n=1 Tax=Pseudaestuariivita atlantica TaxID=1317121 RepID=A0A0L1JND2_9RHOB|nr:hypothetical protein [Pseudaestuariivita atlantica]KNG93270.1 hypothetical protein ATO11_12515 [Pseudaestuariivita atlantica]